MAESTQSPQTDTSTAVVKQSPNNADVGVQQSANSADTTSVQPRMIQVMLDRHEDELEVLYRNQTLTKDAYEQLERELDRLDDRLGDAEDQLEYIFGIDD